MGMYRASHLTVQALQGQHICLHSLKLLRLRIRFRLLRSHSPRASDLVRKITSGSMEQAPADRVLKSIMTAGRSTAAESRAAPWAVNVTVTWKYGTTYLLSLRTMETEIIQH